MDKFSWKGNRAWIAAAVIAPLGFYIGQATLAAGPGSAALIDKDCETAVHTLISKRFYNRIAATDEQRDKLNTLWATTSESTRPSREELRAGAIDLSQMFADDKVSDDQILKKAHELRAVHEQVMDQRLNSMLKARKVLTAEQKQQISERVKNIITGGVRPRRLGALLDVE